MKRLVAVGVKDSWEGGWQYAQGNERAAIAAPIGEGEKVWLEVEAYGDGAAEHKRISLSVSPALLVGLDIIRYRVVKDTSQAVEILPTTVELILGNG